MSRRTEIEVSKLKKLPGLNLGAVLRAIFNPRSRFEKERALDVLVDAVDTSIEMTETRSISSGSGPLGRSVTTGRRSSEE